MEEKLNKPAFPELTMIITPEGIRYTHEKGMTKREYAAIHLRIPDSGDEQIDEMIQRRNRLDAASMAMQGLLASGERLVYDNNLVFGAIRSFEFADELLRKEKDERQ